MLAGCWRSTSIPIWMPPQRETVSGITPPDEGRGVQSEDALLEDPKRFDRQAALLDRLLVDWLDA